MESISTKYIRYEQYFLDTPDKRLSLYVIAFILFEPVLNLLNGITNLIIPGTLIDTLVVYLSLLLIMILAIPELLNRISIIAVIFIGAFITLLCLAVVNLWDLNIIIEALPQMIFGLALLLISTSICNYEYVFIYMKTVAPLTIFIVAINFIIQNLSDSLLADDMGTAYVLLVPLIFCAYGVINGGGFFNWISLIAGAVILFLFGTRGPIVCLIVFWVLYLLFTIGQKRSKILLFITFGGGIIFVVVMFFTSAPVLLKNIMEQLGFHTRIFDFFIADKIFSLSERDLLVDQAIESIIDNPFGYGLFGDRPLLYDTLNKAGSYRYVHNIVLEFWLHFGLFFGSMLLLISVLYIFKLLLQKRDKWMKIMVIILVSINVKLFISGSYLTEPYFYMLIGVIIHQITLEQAHSCLIAKRSRFFKGCAK